jgi:hypothetical protein
LRPAMKPSSDIMMCQITLLIEAKSVFRGK